MQVHVIEYRELTVSLTEEIYKMLEKRSVMFGQSSEAIASMFLAMAIYEGDAACAEEAKEFHRALLILQEEHSERQRHG
jgi:hypothetical protein